MKRSDLIFGLTILLILGLSFGCGSGGGVTNPEVTSVSPASGATDVAVTAAVTAVFNKDMDPTTINISNFRLDPTAVPVGTVLSSRGQSVAATVAYDVASRTATLTPTSLLAGNTSYTATLTATVTDNAGLPLAGDYSWSFTTAAATPVTALYVFAAALYPDGGPIHVLANNDSGAVISNATVTVNGTPWPYDAVNGGYYKWGGGFYAAPGSTLEVVVAWNGLTVIGYSLLPYTPVITEPADGSTCSRAAATAVTWNYGGNPAPEMADISGQDPYFSSPTLTGTTLTYTIPANTFNAGTGSVSVYVHNNGLVFTGPAAPGSVILAGNSRSHAVTWTD